MSGAFGRDTDEAHGAGGFADEGDLTQTDVHGIDAGGVGGAQVGQDGFGIGGAGGLGLLALIGQAFFFGSGGSQFHLAELERGAGFAAEGQVKAHFRMACGGRGIELAEVEGERLPSLSERGGQGLDHGHAAIGHAVAQHDGVQA